MDSFIRRINKVIFLSDVGYFATSLYLKSDILISNFLIIRLISIQSLSSGKNAVACTYISE